MSSSRSHPDRPSDGAPADPDAPENNPRLKAWVDTFDTPLLIAAAAFLVAYAAPILHPAMPVWGHRVAFWVQFLVWAIFLIDLSVRVFLARRRIRYLINQWLDVAAVILPALRPVAALNAVIGRSVLSGRGIRLFRGRMALIVSASTSIVGVVAALAVLKAERVHPDANITTFSDSLWWAMTTITTVGYGDQYPVTVTGRLFASGLMITGIGLLGVITATLATWFVDRVRAAESTSSEQRTSASIAELLQEMQELRAEVSALRDQLNHGRPDPISPTTTTNHPSE